jgi:DNA-binding NtrC family response regulator
VGHLTHHEQAILLEERRASASNLQLLSTSSQPLFRLVEQGVLLVDLYYCLNTVRLDLDQLHVSVRP